MIRVGSYYVMYESISYINEHNIQTGQVEKIDTGWTPNLFHTSGTARLQLLSMAVDTESLYILYRVTTFPTGIYRINKFNHALEYVDSYVVDIGTPTSIASDSNNLYIAYRDKSKVQKVSLTNSNFTPQQTMTTNITDIFGLNGVLYGFERGTIVGALHKVNVVTSNLTRIKQNTQKNGPDYGAQYDKFYGHSYPKYLEYDLATGNVENSQFPTTKINYVLGAISIVSGFSNVNERLTFSEGMFFVAKIKPVYPAIDTVQFQEQSGFPVHENYSSNTDLYIGD